MAHTSAAPFWPSFSSPQASHFRIVARRFCRLNRLRAATYTMALALISVGTGDLVLIADVQAIGILIYCIAIGIAALGIDHTRMAVVHRHHRRGRRRRLLPAYFPIVARCGCPEPFLAVVPSGNHLGPVLSDGSVSGCSVRA